MKPIVTILDKEPPTLERAQALVGGYVERIVVKEGILLVNEEGLLRQLPINPVASAIAGRPIVGHAVLLKGKARKNWR